MGYNSTLTAAFVANLPPEKHPLPLICICHKCGRTVPIGEVCFQLVWGGILCGVCIDKTEAERERNRREKIEMLRLPEIVCLCGSTKFMDAFFAAGWKFTLEGKIVLSVGVCKHADHHAGEALGQEVAEKLDVLHLRKIDLADTVFVLNVGGYIGESTAKEIAYAESQNKPIEYLEEITIRK